MTEVSPLSATSTMTAIAYTNANIDRQGLYDSIQTRHDEATYTTTKNGNIRKKSIKAPYGSIIFKRYGAHWEGICIKKPTGIKPFRGQLSIRMFIETRCVHLLMFKNCITITGAQSQSEIDEVLLILWQDYIQPNPHIYTLTDNNPKFYYYVVMKNFNGHFGYTMDKMAVTKLLSSDMYTDIVREVTYDTGLHHNVKVVLYDRIDKKVYKVLTIPLKGEPTIQVKKGKIPIAGDKKRKIDKSGVKCSLSYTSSITLSGKCKADICYYYALLADIMAEHRATLEEV